MTQGPTRHQQVRQVFEQALACAHEDRAAYLAKTGAHDPALVREVQQLLDAHAAAGSFLSAPVAGVRVPDAPSLSPGARLGAYDVVGVIGAGGMGEVYKARDTRLHRDVALKILPPSFTQDPDRLARFRREAQLLAALNHPNIGAIYDVAGADGTQYLVLEFVDGESLDRRVARGSLPIEEALGIARQIAEALATAHDKGIIHRDLKPANVALTTNGQVKVLDFGLGKAAGSTDTSVDVAKSPNITSPAHYAAPTGVGVLLGTAAYMSPEQARGKPADARSDIWAFGCVVYEMLTGTRAFDGEAMADVLGAVTRLEPDWSRLPADVATPVRVLLESCLVKDVRKRLADIRTASFILDNSAKLTSSVTTDTVSARIRDLRTIMRRRVALLTVAGLAVGAAVSGGLVWVTTRSAPPRVLRAAIPATGSTALSIDAPAGGPDRHLAITPDGRQLVYIGNNASQLFVRPLDQLEPTALVTLSAQESARGGLRGVFTSPDGRWAGYVDTTTLKEETTTLKKIAIAGGPPVPIVKMDGGSRGAAWLPDDTIIFTTNSLRGLHRVSAAGGTATPLTTPSRERGELYHYWPQPLPGGRAVLFTILPLSGDLDAANVAVLDLATGAQRILVQGGSDARYVSSGHLVYAAAGTLRAVSFDLRRLAVSGAPVPVLPNIVTTVEGGADVATALDGTLVFVTPPPGWTPGASVLAWLDRQGREQVLSAEPRWYLHPRLSRDGTRVAHVRNEKPRGIWIWDLALKTPTRVTSGPGVDHFPVWTPDERRIVFTSSRAAAANNLYWQSADGTGTAERLTESANSQFPTGVTPDGQVLFTEFTSTTGRDVMLLTMTPTRRVIPLLHSPANELNAVVSPDGRWLAYQSDSSGRYEVYVRPFPDVDARQWKVSGDGGGQPVWSQNGRELFYAPGDGSLMAVTVTAQGDRWSAELPVPVSKSRAYSLRGVGFGRPYDVSADGRQFLIIKPTSADATAAPQIVVVTHWDEELKRLVRR